MAGTGRALKLPATWRRLRSEERRTAAAARRMRGAVRRAQPESIDGLQSAKIAGLRYVSDERTPGIRRIGTNNRFRYVDPNGRTIGDPAERQRIRALAIPPAWTDVWICPYANGHLQATGRDARGRKQYRYHARWRDVRDEVKYSRVIAFARALPRIRAHTHRDLRRPGLPREKVLATVVQLLEKTLIRVGNEEYARTNHSFGLTTMKDQHARIQGQTVRFEFKGKSGVAHSVDLHDRRLARVVKSCRDLPGYELFQYVDRRGRRQMIDSADVNEYLRQAAGDAFTAKDFRTWAGTVLASKALAGLGRFSSGRQATRNIVRAVEAVAKRLGNTKAVCRKCYIHPAILDAYMNGATIQAVKARAAAFAAARGLGPEERAVVALIEKSLDRPKNRAARA